MQQSFVIKTKTVAGQVCRAPLLNRKFVKTFGGDGIKLKSEEDARFPTVFEAMEFAMRQFDIPKDGWDWNADAERYEHQVFSVLCHCL